MISKQMLIRARLSGVVSGFLALIFCGDYWLRNFGIGDAITAVLSFAVAGFIAALSVQYTLSYSHLGWRRLALLISPIAGVVTFIWMQDASFYSSDMDRNVIFSLGAFLTAGTMLLLARNVVLWVLEGFKMPSKEFVDKETNKEAPSIKAENAVQPQKTPQKTNDLFGGLRAGLIEAYKPRLVEGVTCVTCGATNAPVSLHMLEFNQPEAMPVSTLLVPMSKSYGTLRGSVPICTACAPICDQCGLPISTPWVSRIGQAIQLKIKGIKIERGNGVCRHVHPILDLLSLTKTVSVIDGE